MIEDVLPEDDINSIGRDKTPSSLSPPNAASAFMTSIGSIDDEQHQSDHCRHSEDWNTNLEKKSAARSLWKRRWVSD
jgi:hypothetical protein